MKKVFAAFLALALVCAVLVIAPAAAGTNPSYDIEFTDKAPTVDGTISANEYGRYPLVSWTLAEDGATDEVILGTNYEITDDPDLAIEFYATWTDESLYLAWKVTTDYDYRIPDTLSDGWMYEYCCVQFIMTPGAPDSTVQKYQTAEWSGDYLEIGLCLKDDGNSYKVCWSQPQKVNGALSLTDWDFAGSREGKVTTYECRLPWNKTGVDAKGDDASFGLLWAVGAQENYDEVAHGLVEWQDGIIGGKNADNGAIMVLTGSGQGTTVVDPGVPVEGQLPDGLEESPIKIQLLNSNVTTGSVALISRPEQVSEYNGNYSQGLLLRPSGTLDGLDGYYTVVENITGNGSPLTFSSEIEDGDVALLVHSDKSDPSSADAIARELAESLIVGQEVYIFGISVDSDGNLGWKYSNAQVCVIDDPATALYGTWANDTETITFNSDKTGLRGETEFAWEMSDDGELKIDGTKTDWSVEDNTLTLGEDTFTKVTAGDYTALNALIAAAQLLKSDKYTEDSYAAVTAALADATAAVEAGYTSLEQDKIDEAKDALQTAIDGLVDAETSESESSATESTQTSAATSSTDSASGSDGLSGGMIALIVIIVIVVIAAIVVAVILVNRKKKAK